MMSELTISTCGEDNDSKIFVPVSNLIKDPTGIANFDAIEFTLKCKQDDYSLFVEYRALWGDIRDVQLQCTNVQDDDGWFIYNTTAVVTFDYAGNVSYWIYGSARHGPGISLGNESMPLWANNSLQTVSPLFGPLMILILAFGDDIAFFCCWISYEKTHAIANASRANCGGSVKGLCTGFLLNAEIFNTFSWNHQSCS